MQTNISRSIQTIVLLLLITITSYAQQEQKTADAMPEFPGGISNMKGFLNANLKYPENAIKDSVQGRVNVKFVVELDGSITESSVVRPINRDLDAEALKVILSMPKWIPGKIAGEEMRRYCIIPISFRIKNGIPIAEVAIKENIAIEDTTIYETPEIIAEFEGGSEQLDKFISSNIQYPAIALENGVGGKVDVQFVVEKDGEIKNITLVRSNNKDLDTEALRVVANMPKWTPAKNKHEETVRSYVRIPINFIITDSVKKEEIKLEIKPDSTEVVI